MEASGSAGSTGWSASSPGESRSADTLAVSVESPNGELGPGLPDLVWEDSLLRALSNLTAIGSSTVARISHDGFLGGISAPSVAIDGASGLAPRRHLVSACASDQETRV